MAGGGIVIEGARSAARLAGNLVLLILILSAYAACAYAVAGRGWVVCDVKASPAGSQWITRGPIWGVLGEAARSALAVASLGWDSCLDCPSHARLWGLAYALPVLVRELAHTADSTTLNDGQLVCYRCITGMALKWYVYIVDLGLLTHK